MAFKFPSLPTNPPMQVKFPSPLLERIATTGGLLSMLNDTAILRDLLARCASDSALFLSLIHELREKGHLSGADIDAIFDGAKFLVYESGALSSADLKTDTYAYIERLSQAYSVRNWME
jgi:hypothetical protein